MTELVQMTVVTAAAGLAFIAIVRPYFERRPAGGAPCPRCASGAAACGSKAPAIATHPLRFVKLQSPK